MCCVFWDIARFEGAVTDKYGTKVEWSLARKILRRKGIKTGVKKKSRQYLKYIGGSIHIS
jgi:hypothetical protein